MPLLTREEYLYLLKELETYEDIHRIHEERGLSRELLLVIHTHRVTRDATRRYYTVLNHAREMVSEWDHGKSYTEIARKWGFPPVLIAQMIEKQKQTPRTVFWDAFRRPDEVSDPRIKAEVKEAMAADWIYSPRGGEIQRERGIQGEKRLHDWLEKYSIPYRTERELRGKFSKTPDALLGKPIGINGMRVEWIESKANFGDDVEIRRNVKKQLKPYVELFGEGIVVYWFGHVKGVPSEDGIMVMDGEAFEALVPTQPPARRVRPAEEPMRESPSGTAPLQGPGPSIPRERYRTRSPRGGTEEVTRRKAPGPHSSPRAPEESQAQPRRPRRRTADRSAYF